MIIKIFDKRLEESETFIILEHIFEFIIPFTIYLVGISFTPILFKIRNKNKWSIEIYSCAIDKIKSIFIIIRQVQHCFCLFQVKQASSLSLSNIKGMYIYVSIVHLINECNTIISVMSLFSHGFQTHVVWIPWILVLLFLNFSIVYALKHGSLHNN